MSYDNRGATEHQVGQWVRDQVLAKKLECKELVLRHVTMDSRPQGDVASYDIPVGDLTPAHDVDTIVGQVMESAQADADSVGGSVQMYALYATFKNSDHVFRKVFRVSPQTDFERDVKPSEPPTNEGLAGQAMRHLEAVMKTSVASQGYLFSLLERQLQRLQDKDERSDQQKLDMMMLVQEVIDGSHTRRLAERKEEASQGMKENALEYLKVAAPIILNRLAGKPLFPEKNKSFMLMASLLENLRPDQQALLRDSLDPAQLSVLAEVLGEYERDKAEFEKRSPASTLQAAGNSLPPTEESGDPESPRTPRIFQKVRDRLLEVDDRPRDPVLQRLEQRGADFTRHLTVKDKTGEPGDESGE
jgi:hypothetical protein